MNATERAAEERRVKQKAGAMAGILFLGVTVLCYFLTAYTLMDPPAGDQYVAVGMADLGNSLTASGDTESDVPSETVNEAMQPQQATSASMQNASSQVVTQAQSAISNPSQQQAANPNQQGQQSGSQVSSSLSSRLSSLNSGGGGSQGSGQTGTGNEGLENGEPFTTGSDGNSDWGLQGGDMIGKPQLDEKPTKAGLIRMNIRVDKQGNVIGIPEYDPKGSSLADARSIDLARRAAKTARFTKSTTLPVRSGYIVIRFELK